MTQDLAQRGQDTEQHPFDYYWRPGQELRPQPPRIRVENIWSQSRRSMLSPWIDFQEIPRETPLTRLLGDHYWQGDARMDAVVAKFREIGMAEGRRLLDQALDHGIDSLQDPPQELAALFEEIDNPPAWHDHAMVERGRLLWNNASFTGKLGMGAGDFFGTFVGEEVSYATGETGRYITDSGRRNYEQNAWFHAVTVKDGLTRSADPFKNVVRLRLMHAQVRAGLRRVWGDEPDAHEAPRAEQPPKGPRGHFSRHGNPISATHVMVAAVTFGLQPLLIDHRLGRKCAWADLDAAMAYWAYIAYLLGVPDELVPRDAATGIAIMDYGVAHSGNSSEWTDIQIGAAVNGTGLSARARRALLAPVLGAFAYYTGETLARALVRGTDMRNARLQPWITVYGVFARANIALRRVLDLVPGAERRMAARNDDWFWRIAMIAMRPFAEREGVREAAYDHHDATAGIAPGAAIPQIGKCPMGH